MKDTNTESTLYSSVTDQKFRLIVHSFIHSTFFFNISEWSLRGDAHLQCHQGNYKAYKWEKITEKKKRKVLIEKEKIFEQMELNLIEKLNKTKLC